MKEAIFIDGRRDGYHPTQCSKTCTVGELIDFLTEMVDECYYDRDSEIFINNDNGYTYGSICVDDFKQGKYDSDHVEIDEY